VPVSYAVDADAPSLPVVQWRTWANLATVVRTVGSVVLALLGIVEQSLPLLVLSYGVYWVGDSLDGNLARWLRQETRFGAVLDIVSDRANSALLIGGLLALRPEFAWPLGIYFLQFMVVDLVLTLSFLCWPLVSPNHFHRVDRTVWTLNWSVPAKTLNTTLLIVVLLVAPVGVATVVAVAQLAVKLGSAVRVHTLLRDGTSLDA
jgi:phosphatidylglycerophosphate synthase